MGGANRSSIYRRFCSLLLTRLHKACGANHQVCTHTSTHTAPQGFSHIWHEVLRYIQFIRLNCDRREKGPRDSIHSSKLFANMPRSAIPSGIKRRLRPSAPLGEGYRGLPEHFLYLRLIIHFAIHTKPFTPDDGVSALYGAQRPGVWCADQQPPSTSGAASLPVSPGSPIGRQPYHSRDDMAPM